MEDNFHLFVKRMFDDRDFKTVGSLSNDDDDDGENVS